MNGSTRARSLFLLLSCFSIAMASVAMTGAPALAEINSRWVEYTHGTTKLKAYMAFDDKVTGKRPAVLVIHAREGMSQKTRDLTEMWAKLGYVAFAADIYGFGEGILPKTIDEMNAQTVIYTKDRALMQSRTRAAFDALVGQPMVDAAKIAAIGYCFGGAVGVEFGSTGAPLMLNIAIHGSFRDHPAGWAKNAKGMFVLLHGAEDTLYPLDTVDAVVQELRAAKTPFHLEVYSGTNHGFSTPKNKAEERANAQSIATAARTMKEVFGM
jgi:dienelactone hydrolase